MTFFLLMWKNNAVRSRFEEIAQIIEKTDMGDKLGVCLDTCHVYDAGYDIVGDLDGVVDEFDRIIGLDRLKAIHLNDSKNPFESTLVMFNSIHILGEKV